MFFSKIKLLFAAMLAISAFECSAPLLGVSAAAPSAAPAPYLSGVGLFDFILSSNEEGRTLSPRARRRQRRNERRACREPKEKKFLETAFTFPEHRGDRA